MSFWPRSPFGRAREVEILEGIKKLEGRVHALQAALNECLAADGRYWVSDKVAVAGGVVILMLGLMVGFGLGVYREPISGFAVGLAQRIGLARKVPSAADAENAVRKGNYTTALRLARPLAESGDAHAQFVLGVVYYDGIKDYIQAATWFRRAADQGNASAQLYLGLMSNDGHGVPQDYVKAGEWYRRAAEQGEVHAQHNLGVYYATGKLGPVDNVSAYMWLSLASAYATVSDPGYRLSVSVRDQAAKSMTPDQIAEAQRRATEWKPK
jgi:Sel1 repeat